MTLFCICPRVFLVFPSTNRVQTINIQRGSMRSYRLFVESVKKIIPDVQLHEALDSRQESLVDILLEKYQDEVPRDVIILYLETGKCESLLRRLRGAEAVSVLYREWKTGQWSDWKRG